jgi:hypothetical protein
MSTQVNWEALFGWGANLIQIGSFLVVLFLFLRARAQYRSYVKGREQATGGKPWAVAIGINGDISGQVRPFLDENGLADIKIENYVHKGFVPTDKFYDVLRDMIKLKQKLTTAGATDILLFYKGPVSLAMGIGAIFDNWVPVKIYEYSAGTYHLDFVLDKGTIIGLMGSGPGSTIEDVFSV